MIIGTNRALHSSLPCDCCLIDNSAGQRDDCHIICELVGLLEEHCQFATPPAVLSEGRIFRESEADWIADNEISETDVPQCRSELIDDLTDLLASVSGLNVFWWEGSLYSESEDCPEG